MSRYPSNYILKQQAKEIKHSYNEVTRLNEQYQFDLLFVSYNVFEGNTYKSILTGVNFASRYKVARAFSTKKASEVAFMLEAIIINLFRLISNTIKKKSL